MKTKQLLATTALLVILMCACEDLYYYPHCNEGEGAITEELFTENDFTGIELTSSYNIIVKQGHVQEIKAVGHENIIDALEIYESNGNLVCGLKNGCYRNYELTIYITVPAINNLRSFGSGNITMEDFCNQGNLNTEVSGSGNIIINSSAGTQSIDATISGSGDMVVNKNFAGLNRVNAEIFGSGSFRAFPLATNEFNVSVFGSGDCYCTVNAKLSVTITDSGNVYYKGYPDIDSDCFGSGKVINHN